MALMDPTMSKPQETIVDERKQARQSWRPRVPTSLLLTVFVALLSVLVAPAVVRQWDDRQKAHELKVALMSEMATATSRALIDAQNAAIQNLYVHLGLVPSQLPPAIRLASWRTTPATEMEWARRSTRIEAQLRAYFGHRQADEWRHYRWLVGLLMSSAAAGRVSDAYGEAKDLPPNAAKIKNEIYSFYANQFELLPYLHNWKHRADFLQIELSFFRAVKRGLAEIQYRLLAYEDRLSHEVLASHIDGYSVTRRHLVQDLLP
jgi:hypothetical protein